MKARRILSSLLAALLLVSSFSACSSSGNQSSSSQTESTSSTVQSEETGYTSSTGIPISDPGEYPIVEETYNLDVFIKQSSDVADIETNDVTKAMEELTNVHLDMTIATEEAYTERLNLLLNTGDYPSVIMSAGFSNADLVKYGSEEKIFIPPQRPD